MLQNAYLLTNFGFGTAENEPIKIFKNCKILEKCCQFCYPPKKQHRPGNSVFADVPAFAPALAGEGPDEAQVGEVQCDSNMKLN